MLHALSHLRAADFRGAGPPLVTGVEGLYWSVAEEDGYLDGRGRFSPVSGRTGKPTNAIDIINALPLNTRVQTLLKKRAFGGAANSFRHGRVHSIGEEEQCRLWMLALIAWLDGYGWRRFAQALAAAPTDEDLPEGGANR